MKNYFLSCLILVAILFSSCSTEAPLPYGQVPNERQLNWHKMEYYMFVHFGPNTFTDKEWGDGKEDPKVFNPSALDCKQWVETAQAAGMEGLIVTAKHHDGFCLWPSEYSTHTVRESKWKDGKGDVLKELSEACREAGLKFGVYLSPWDQNHPAYGTAEYNQVFASTLAEVYTNYGPDIFEQWFDGACGEGVDGKKQEYDWDLFHKTVYGFNPNTVIFSDVGPDCRWMGNERGVAGETNWATLNIKGFGPGLAAPAPEVLNAGNMNGEQWVPAEVDVSIRPGWFYSPTTNDKVKTIDELMDIYYTSVGRNSNLLLNVPPDRNGRIHPADSARLMEFRRARESVFVTDLALGAKITASNVRGESARFDVSNLLNDNYDSYWAMDDNIPAPYVASVEVDFGEKKIFNRLLLQEYIPLGQRVANFTLSCKKNDEWVKIANATTIGYKRILRFDDVESSMIKIEFEESLACPVLNKVGVYYDAEGE